jgi:hypothetical protein
MRGRNCRPTIPSCAGSKREPPGELSASRSKVTDVLRCGREFWRGGVTGGVKGIELDTEVVWA